MKKLLKPEVENKLIDTVLENMTGEIPEEMYEVRIDEMVRDFEYRLQMQGMDLETYLEVYRHGAGFLPQNLCRTG